MRRIRLLATVLLPTALMAAGCVSSVPRAGGPAGPVTPPAASSAPSTTPPASPATASPSARPTPSHSAPAPHRTSQPAVLGPYGFGALKLGMSKKQAVATGLISAWKDSESGGCAPSRLVGAPKKGEAGAAGVVLGSSRLGVATIDAYPGIRTPEGIHLGSTTKEMFKAYPDWENAEHAGSHAEGRGGARVPGNKAAVYRIVTWKGKVVELTLQLGLQDCYE